MGGNSASRARRSLARHEKTVACNPVDGTHMLGTMLNITGACAIFQTLWGIYF
jgi:hypothetical protein